MSFNLKLSKPSRINCSQLFPELLLRALGECEGEGGKTGDAILHRKMIRKLNPLPPQHSAHSSACGCHNKYAKSLPAAGAPHTHTRTQSHVAAEGHKLHKTGPRNGHSRIVQLGTSVGKGRGQQNTQLVASWVRGQLIICKICRAGLQGGGSN